MRRTLWLIPFATFALLFLVTIGKHPLVFVDSQNSVLGSKPTILISKDSSSSPLSFNSRSSSNQTVIREKLEPVLIYKYGDTQVPILHQERHGGLPFVPFKLLYKFLGCRTATTLWHLITSLITIGLFGIVLKRAYSSRVAFIGMMLLAIDPIEIASYGIFFTEPLNKIGILLVLYLFQNRNSKSLLISGLLIGLNFYIRINFLWFILAIIPFVYRRIKKDYKPVLAGILLSSLPYFALIDLTKFFHEVASVQQSMGFDAFFSDLFNMIANKREFLSLINSEEFTKTPLILSIITAILFLIPLTASLFFKNYRAPKEHYLSLLIFCSLIWISIQTNNIYSIYFFGANLLICVIFAIFIDRIIDTKKVYVVLSLSIFIIQSLNWIIPYSRLGAASPVSYTLHRQIAQDLLEMNILHPYTIGEGDIGKLEYVSDERITPNHLSHLLLKNNILHVEALTFLSEGTIIIPMQDPWSSWYGHWPPINIKRWKELANRLNIVITNEKIYSLNGKDKIWRFSFKKIKP